MSVRVVVLVCVDVSLGVTVREGVAVPVYEALREVDPVVVREGVRDRLPVSEEDHEGETEGDGRVGVMLGVREVDEVCKWGGNTIRVWEWVDGVGVLLNIFWEWRTFSSLFSPWAVGGTVPPLPFSTPCFPCASWRACERGTRRGSEWLTV